MSRYCEKRRVNLEKDYVRSIMIQSKKSILDRQFHRQSLWLKEHILWLLDNNILNEKIEDPARLLALDVGCGPGFIMDIIQTRMVVKGIDMDPDMVAMCKARKFDVIKGEAESLPFDNNYFDLTYCSFLLMWAKDPVKIVRELIRVSKRWVICLAEPDFGARISYPIELAGLDKFVINGIQDDSGDPFIGRKLRKIFRECGLDAELGIHPGLWSSEKLRLESDDEWQYVKMTAHEKAKKDELDNFRTVWIDALNKGTLFQFNPIFYAIGRKRVG